jgi:glycosyltransferase involved in cell wall biosynthesis
MKPASLTVTAVIPMRNEAGHIAKCLESILCTSLPASELEILVVDGMSTDRSRDIVAEYAAIHVSIRLLDNPAKIVPAGLNIGIREARGRVIVIIGAHCEYPHDYLLTCVQELQRTGADVVGGTLITNPGADTLVARGVALMTGHPFGVGGSAFRTGKAGGFVDTVPYGAYRRDVFERVGLFSEKLIRNQDFEFNARVRAAGGKLFLSPLIRINYFNVPSLSRLVKQAFGNGLWLARMWFLSPPSFRMRHAIPLIFVLVLLLCLLLSPVLAWAGIVGLIVLAAYATAAVYAAGQISGSKGVRYFFPLLGLFFIHHVMYGTGTLVSFVHAVRSASTTPH